MKKAVIYARVSSRLQNIESSIEAQVRACRDYALKNTLEVINLFIDRAESGRTDQRPAFLEMIVAARQKKFNTILVHKLDRFSRSREDSITYKSLLKKLGVELISVTEQLKDDIYSKLIEGILETVAEFYSLNLGQEIKKGQLQSIRKNFYPASRCPYGYVLIEKDGHKIPVIDEEKAPIIEKIFNLSAQGKYKKDIISFLNSSGAAPPDEGSGWHGESISYILKNPFYYGAIRYAGRIEKESHHPAIINKETWLKAQKKLQGNKGRPGAVYPLSSVLYCSLCGRKLNGSNKSTRYYRCPGYTRKYDCTPKMINAGRIEAKIKTLVIDALGELKIEKAYSGKKIKKELEIEIKDLKKELAIINKEKNNIINAIASGFPSEEFKDKLTSLIQARAKIEENLNIKKMSLENSETIPPKTIIRSINKILPQAKQEELKNIYPDLIKVEYNLLSGEGILNFLSLQFLPPITFQVK